MSSDRSTSQAGAESITPSLRTEPHFQQRRNSTGSGFRQRRSMIGKDYLRGILTAAEQLVGRDDHVGECSVDVIPAGVRIAVIAGKLLFETSIRQAHARIWRAHRSPTNDVDQKQLAEPLLAHAKERCADLIGPNGLLNQLTKNVLETAWMRSRPISSGEWLSL
nr:hypothetical protein [Rhodococcus wratislaviensis]